MIESASRKAATTSRESDEEREKNRFSPSPRRFREEKLGKTSVSTTMLVNFKISFLHSVLNCPLSPYHHLYGLVFDLWNICTWKIAPYRWSLIAAAFFFFSFQMTPIRPSTRTLSYHFLLALALVSGTSLLWQR